jgi:hypothetical protein
MSAESRVNARLILFHLVLLAFTGCERDKVVPVPKSTSVDCGALSNVSFSGCVQPLINTHCVTCHDNTAGIQLYDYAHVAAFAASGQLKGVITGNPNYTPMPPLPHEPLDSCSIQAIVKWTEQGALNN